MSVSLGEIVDALGGELVGGERGTPISRIAPLDSAGAGDLSFLSNPRYRQQLASAGGIGLQLLGLGLNGHVGFNEPPCPVDAPCRCLELSDTTRRQNASAFGGNPEAVPRRAITLGLAEILAAQRLVLVVTGAAKAAILGRLIASAPSADLPASWLRSHPNLELVVDRAAAAALLPAAMPG